MPFADGGNLRNYIKTKREFSEKMLIARNVVNGIKFLHENDIVHENIVGDLIFNLFYVILLSNELYFIYRIQKIFLYSMGLLKFQICRYHLMIRMKIYISMKIFLITLDTLIQIHF